MDVLVCPGSAPAEGNPCALFWPESDSERARNSLSQSLTHLRRSLGEEVLSASVELVAVNPAIVRSDAADFPDLLEAGRVHDALAVYEGEFLRGFHVADLPEFERWVSSERDRLRTLARKAAAAACDEAARASAWESAADFARRGLAIQPRDEQMASRLVEALARSGNRAGAIEAYETFRTSLANDLGVEPGRPLQQQVEALRLARSPQPHESSTSPVPAVATGVPVSATLEPRSSPAPRLTGRLVRAASALALVAGAVVLAGAVVRWRSARSEAAETAVIATERIVAVLPFANMSGDSADEYFSTGLTEDVVAQLVKVSGIRVLPFAQTRGLPAEKSIAELASEVGATEIVRGAVRREGDRVRITVHLVDPATATNQWSETYDRRVTDVLSVQAEIAQRIAAAMGLRVLDRFAVGKNARSAASYEAYDLALRARQVMHSARDNRALHDSVLSLARRAVVLGPQTSAAHAIYAQALINSVWVRGGGDQWHDSAVVHAQAAASLDPEFAGAHQVLSNLYSYKRWHRRALAEATEAVRLDPQYDLAWAAVSSFHYSATGRLDEALLAALQFDRLVSAAPIPRGDGEHKARVARLLLLFDESEGAEAWARKSIDMFPTVDEGYRQLARVMVLRGQHEEAEAVLDQARRQDSDVILAALADLALIQGQPAVARDLFERSIAARSPLGPHSIDGRYAGLENHWTPETGIAATLVAEGRSQEAERWLSAREDIDRRLLKGGSDDWGPPYDLAAIHAIRGDHQAALRWLEKAVEFGFRSSRFASLDPRLQALRQDPGFEALMLRIRTDVQRMREATLTRS